MLARKAWSLVAHLISQSVEMCEAETNSRRRIWAHPQRQRVRYFTEKEEQSERGFLPTHLPERILEGDVLCSYSKHAVEKDGWVQCYKLIGYATQCNITCRYRRALMHACIKE